MNTFIQNAFEYIYPLNVLKGIHNCTKHMNTHTNKYAYTYTYKQTLTYTRTQKHKHAQERKHSRTHKHTQKQPKFQEHIDVDTRKKIWSEIGRGRKR